MFRNKKWLVIVNLVAIAGMILSACAAPTPAAAPTQPPAPGATEPPAPAATEPPAPAATEPPAAPTSKDPETFIYQTFGDPDTLDPSILYDTASSGVAQNIYETLVIYDGADPNAFVPLLAEEIPDAVLTDEGGVSYTWTIKDGVKFHNGNDLTAEDVAYSFWRTMLLADPNTPGFLVLEAFSGFHDSTELIDAEGTLVGDPDLLKAAPAADLAVACETVKSYVTFDDAARSVTMNLSRPWGPLLATLAGGQWAAVMDKDWMIEQGDWDGDCATWQNYYGIPSESGLIRDKTNGTGPYMLDHWTPEEEVVLVSNPDYRDGEPAIKRVVVQNVVEFGTRFAALQAGDADKVTPGSQADYVQLDTLVRDECDINTGECTTTNPDGIVRVYRGQTQLSRTDIFFNFRVEEGSLYIGTGLLDGEGIPPDFFSDPQVRKAFQYCFDWETYIKDVQLGLGVQSAALTLAGQPGHEGTPTYTFDLAKCEEEFKASTWTAEDGRPLWDVGFYFQMAYNAGNTARQSIAEILSANLQQVNPNFFISPVALPWPVFLRTLRAKQFPMATSGWQEDIHDPHNWYVPYLQQTYASRFNMPEDLVAKYTEFINQGVLETDPAKRAEIYSQLNNEVYNDAPVIILSVATANIYEPLFLHGWYEGLSRNPLISSYYYADFTKD